MFRLSKHICLFLLRTLNVLHICLLVFLGCLHQNFIGNIIIHRFQMPQLRNWQFVYMIYIHTIYILTQKPYTQQFPFLATAFVIRMPFIPKIEQPQINFKLHTRNIFGSPALNDEPSPNHSK